MLKKILKYLDYAVTTIAVTAVLYLCWWAGMNYAGYCHAQHRFLSDEEIIEAAVTDLINSYPPAVSKISSTDASGNVTQEWFVPEKSIPYESFNDFMKINRNCCETINYAKDGYRPGLLSKFSGLFSKFARIKYKVMYIEGENTKETLIESYVAVGNCGNIFNDF